MKFPLSPVLLATGIALSGCQTMPDMNDTTNPTLRLRVHYETPGIGTPNVEVVTTTSVAGNRCLYVNEPFGISANASDKGGIKSIVIGPSAYPFDGLKARAADTAAIPGPAEATQTVSGTTVANPGITANGAEVRVAYSTAKTFDTVTLVTAYDFAKPGTMRIRGTVRNWGQSTGVAEVYEFHVIKAVPGDPARQAGKACAIP